MRGTASFPSGHTLNATVIAGIVCYLLLHWFRTRGVRTLAIVIAALYALTMGLSRVYLGHHWLTDVIAGWLIGIGWVAVVITLPVVAHRPHTARRTALDHDAHPLRPAPVGCGGVEPLDALRPEPRHLRRQRSTSCPACPTGVRGRLPRPALQHRTRNPGRRCCTHPLRDGPRARTGQRAMTFEPPLTAQRR